MEIDSIARASATRAARWHDGNTPWSLLEWAGAMAGEAGEACNAAKKHKRLTQKMATINEEGRHYNLSGAAEKVCEEAADTILYALCLINEAGGDPEDVLRKVFNRKSEEYGFPERI